MPALSNKQKTKCNNMATAHQPWSLLQPSSAEQWKKAEQRRGMGYSGPPAEKTVREHKQKAWEAEMIAQEIQKG